MADDRTYIRVHDGMDDHPKIVGLSDGAFRLLMRAWSYCSRQLTDGRLPEAAWKDRGSAKSRRELVDAGLAHLPGFACDHSGCPTPPPRHVQMHDYLEHQRSAAEVAELKRRRAEAGRKGGKSRANAQASAKQVLEQNGSKTEASTETETDTYKRPSVQGGSLVSSDALSAPPLYPDHCRKHGFIATPGKCGDCADQRKANAVNGEPLPDYRLRVVPPLCGECDERWIETPSGLAKCPRCYPQERSA